jgi:hypothetical protein
MEFCRLCQDRLHEKPTCCAIAGRKGSSQSCQYRPHGGAMPTGLRAPSTHEQADRQMDAWRRMRRVRVRMPKCHRRGRCRSATCFLSHPTVLVPQCLVLVDARPDAQEAVDVKMVCRHSMAALQQRGAQGTVGASP